MFETLKTKLRRGPSRADLIEQNTRLRQLLGEAHFRDKAGKMLPKGSVPKHLAKLSSD